MSMTDDHHSQCSCSSCQQVNRNRLALGLDKSKEHLQVEAERDALRAEVLTLTQLLDSRCNCLHWKRECDARERRLTNLDADCTREMKRAEAAEARVRELEHDVEIAKFLVGDLQYRLDKAEGKVVEP